MLPTRSHSGILTPAMLSRGPKGYLTPSQRASWAGGPSRAARAHKVVAGRRGAAGTNQSGKTIEWSANWPIRGPEDELPVPNSSL